MATMMELRIEIDQLTEQLAARDATIELLRKDPGQRGCEAAWAISQGTIRPPKGRTKRQHAAELYQTNDRYVQYAIKLLDDDRELFDAVRAGKMKIMRALAECTARHAEMEDKHRRRRRSS